MVAKLFPPRFVLFGCDFVGTAQNDFRRNSIKAQIVLPAFLVSFKKS
jgi:hypothetical protein